jgi:Putative prokaryotic signal transducing protein
MFKKTNRSPGAIPRFCPGCKLDEFGDREGSTCPECGDTLRAKGFCPVCERHLLQVAGDLCPKHDIELEPPQTHEFQSVREGPPAPWVTVSVFPNSATAAILQGRLEAEGIPTILDGERMGTAGMYFVATRGVRLQVPADRVGDARIILSQNWSLPDDEKADFEDLL